MPDRPIYVTKAFLPPLEEFVEALGRIWETAVLTNQGPLHNELAGRLRAFLKVERLVLFGNGHQALEFGLQALRLRGEVITTPFSFPSTTHAIVRCGLTPVFCDIRLRDCNMDETQLEALITERTAAILPVHVYGIPCNGDAIQRIAARHRLKVVYDAAHAFGVEVQGAGIGSWGDVSMFSFHATKAFHTIEGGALALRDAELERALDLSKNFGIAGPEDVQSIGANAKMNELQALMGLVNLKYTEREIACRRSKVAAYRKLLTGVPGVRCLEQPAGVKANYAYLTVLIDESEYGITRDELVGALVAHDIHPRKYFYPLIPDYACYRDRFSVELPVARYVADRVITLPLWGEMPDEAVERTCRVIGEAHRGRRSTTGPGAQGKRSRGPGHGDVTHRHPS
jgi:dTDP-4-amino-4,6-dideoxygalactose transaminase